MYISVNNILVIVGDLKLIKAVLEDEEVIDKHHDITDDEFNARIRTVNGHKEAVLYYDTDSDPYEEFPVFIKHKYPQLRIFLSSVEYEGWTFAYYKEFSVDGLDKEYKYGTMDYDKINTIFHEFILKRLK